VGREESFVSVGLLPLTLQEGQLSRETSKEKEGENTRGLRILHKSIQKVLAVSQRPHTTGIQQEKRAGEQKKPGVWREGIPAR